MYSRKDVKERLREWAFNQPELLAAWEGGSAATGFVDDYSDLDVCLVCKDQIVEDVFEAIESDFKKAFGIVNQYRLPEPTWHGFSQGFYKLGDVEALFYVDICVIKESLMGQMEDRLTESDRHGDAVIWFDKNHMVQTDATPKALTEKRLKKVYDAAIQLDFVMELEVRKAIARGNFLEAFPRYYTFLTRNLIPLMNLKYRPVKCDFGPRYIYREFPYEEAQFVERCMKVHTIDMMKEVFDEMALRYYELKKE